MALIASPSALNNNAPTFSVSNVLNQISNELWPAQDHSRKCQEITNEIIFVLEKELGSGIAQHTLVAGSYGKGTAIANDSDYDIVIFFKDLNPPFIKTLQDIESAIKTNAIRFSGFNWRFRSRIHVSFEVEGISFDLTPASRLDNITFANRWGCFAPFMLTSSPSQQHAYTLQKIRELPDPENQSYYYSSSMSVDAVLFVQRQSHFVHSVIRLAKYWAKHLNFTGKLQIRGKSVLIETIAIYACYTFGRVQMTDDNMDKAFMRFLELISDLSHVRLYVFMNYQREDIPNTVFNQTPMVLDPVNPYNNLLAPLNFPEPALKCFQEAAQITMKKINSWKGGDSENILTFKNSLTEFL